MWITILVSGQDCDQVSDQDKSQDILHAVLDFCITEKSKQEASHTDQRSSNAYSCKHDSHFPPRHDKKHPVICYWVSALESYLIVQIWSDYAKLSSEKSGI